MVVRTGGPFGSWSNAEVKLEVYLALLQVSWSNVVVRTIGLSGTWSIVRAKIGRHNCRSLWILFRPDGEK